MTQIKTEITSVYRFRRKWHDDQYPKKAESSQKILDDLSKSLEDRKKGALEFYKSNGVAVQEIEPCR